MCVEQNSQQVGARWQVVAVPFWFIQVDIEQVGELRVKTGNEKPRIVKSTTAIGIALVADLGRLDICVHRPASDQGLYNRRWFHLPLSARKPIAALETSHSQKVGKAIQSSHSDGKGQLKVVEGQDLWVYWNLCMQQACPEGSFPKAPGLPSLARIAMDSD